MHKADITELSRPDLCSLLRVLLRTRKIHSDELKTSEKVKHSAQNFSREQGQGWDSSPCLVAWASLCCQQELWWHHRGPSCLPFRLGALCPTVTGNTPDTNPDSLKGCLCWLCWDLAVDRIMMVGWCFPSDTARRQRRNRGGAGLRFVLGLDPRFPLQMEWQGCWGPWALLHHECGLATSSTFRSHLQHECFLLLFFTWDSSSDL